MKILFGIFSLFIFASFFISSKKERKEMERFLQRSIAENKERKVSPFRLCVKADGNCKVKNCPCAFPHKEISSILCSEIYRCEECSELVFCKEIRNDV